ncbi:hypothetical protein [Erwinia sp. SLM-02]|uniref:hypothetical protein n=1 Tax=Erwinia sp. SLM-02 TaxID=3020057 RepID=UPI0030808615
MAITTTDEIKELLSKVSRGVVKMIPYMTVLSGMIIWSYLNNIGRLDLLMDSFSINIGLVSLLISSIILSCSIGVILTLPSAILILHHSIIPDLVKKPFSLPWFGWGLCVLFLIIAFLPGISGMKEMALSPLKLSFVIAILSLAICIMFSLMNDDFIANDFLDKLNNIFRMLVASILLTSSTLSISIPVTFLMKNSSGESIVSLMIALVFMLAFAFLSFLPAIVYYKEVMKKPFKNEVGAIIPLAKKISITAIICIIFTSLLFPNVSTSLISSSLYFTGITDNRNHQFLVSSESYQPEMFPQHIWMTTTKDKIEKGFFIYGLRMFSLGDKSLICPDSVGNLKRIVNRVNYDSLRFSDNNQNSIKLKEMTSICVVMTSEDAQQWDTLFYSEDKDKDK